jgi:hypothetical protein
MEIIFEVLTCAKVAVWVLIALLVTTIIYHSIKSVCEERQYQTFKQENPNRFFLIYGAYKQNYFEQELRVHFEGKIDFINLRTKDFTPIKHFPAGPRFIFESMHKEAGNYTAKKSPYLCFIDGDNCKAISLRAEVASDFHKKQSKTKMQIQQFLNLHTNGAIT